ncbi:methionine--tRNA ligase [Labrys monachus]|uniref:Methionine--tRNA ligase n=1 Tax=Labrys monachus TaxID=217067 RepID=A0ABU0FEB8_9HYPH|nr:methionine--tRNA ligase [Labrys monachus]MDQ0392951.1 methionyl-tRNA synthetase [Labrys monachus]
MADKDTYYVTTAISYPNGRPHIGHAYELIATDAIARFKRLDGHEVFFLTGTDEHGQKMLQTAAREGLTAQALADRNSQYFREMAQALNASNDDFIRTTEERHYRACQEIWRRMEAAGDIYLSKYAGWYSVRDEAYYDDKDLALNSDGSRTVIETGTKVEWVEEESYFFRLSSFQDRLLKFYEDHPDFIGPAERRNEILSFVRSGLRDLSVSRTTFDWGIPVPGDPKHVMYVWVDALTNYLTATGFPDIDTERSEFWPANAHIIGKDIVRFHTVYWPAFLMSAGLPLPRHVFGHGFLFNRGEKMSKSVGNVIDPFTLAAHYGVDQLRYFFLREVPFGQDGNYSHEAIVNRINADLANDFGNLAQRSLSMIARNCGGRIPSPGDLLPSDADLLQAADGLVWKARDSIYTFALHIILADIWGVVAEANRYFQAEAPWTLKTSDPARMETVLYVTAEIIRQVAILAQPVIPEGAGRILDLLAVPPEARDFSYLGADGRLSPDTELPPPQPVFPKYVEAASEPA